MKKNILHLATVLVVLFVIYDTYSKSYHKDQIYRYELTYIIHNPTTETTKTFIFYSHYDSDQNDGKMPNTSLIWHKGANHLYVNGLTFKGTDKTSSYLLDHTANPITIVGIKKTN